MSKSKASGKDTSKTGEVKQDGFIKAPPFISVMVLNYNHGDLLGRALEACAAQTFRDFEIVMINNGAIDNTEQVYHSFCEKYPEIKTTYVLIEQNLGPMHGLNEGLKRAQGDYVMFNDADDWMEPDCLERLAQKAKETDADRVMGQHRVVQPDGRIIKVRRFTEYRPIPCGYYHAAIFRRSIILLNGVYFLERGIAKFIGSDNWFVCRFAKFQRNTGAIVCHIIYNYYMNPRSLSISANRNNNVEECNSEMKTFLNCVAETVKMGNTEEIQREIEYLGIRITYSRILDGMRYLPPKEAKRFHEYSVAVLTEELPNWRKNPFIWPFGNGYQLFESICTYALIQLDRVHAIWLIRLAEKMSRVLKYRR